MLLHCIQIQELGWNEISEDSIQEGKNYRLYMDAPTYAAILNVFLQKSEVGMFQLWSWNIAHYDLRETRQKKNSSTNIISIAWAINAE